MRIFNLPCVKLEIYQRMANAQENCFGISEMENKIFAKFSGT